MTQATKTRTTARHVVWVIAAAACGAPRPPAPASAALAPLSVAADARMVSVPAGRSIAGSTPEERAAAYDDFQATAGHDGARIARRFESEEDRRVVEVPAFWIDLLPVTQAQYAELVATGTVAAPTIDEAAWKAQGLAHDYATQVARFAWRDGRPPADREDHPVVLVTWAEAAAYCAWRGRQVAAPRRLPSSAEYEKAARGHAGTVYPWGNVFEAQHLNSAVDGPGDTTSVGSHVAGASPYGVLELAGNVAQWTSTKHGPGEMTVKGSAWDDHAGAGRGAARAGRRADARHVTVGFRCAASA